jgi:hypothetical protein
MHLTANILYSMIDNLMEKLSVKAIVRSQGIAVECGTNSASWVCDFA